jgi:hypothetical protein
VTRDGAQVHTFTAVCGYHRHVDSMTTARAPRQSTAARGYGNHHQQHRAQWRPYVDALQVNCARCGKLIVPDPMQAGDGWDLDHDDERRTYLGPSHASCNRSAGQAKAQQLALPGASKPPRKVHGFPASPMTLPPGGLRFDHSDGPIHR